MKSYVPPLFVLLFFLLIIRNPGLSIAAASDGLGLWYSQVLPSLFPSMILTSLLVRSNLLSGLLARCPGLSQCSVSRAIPLISGMLCGYPIGAKTCCDLYALGQLNRREVNYLSGFVHCPSPMFLLGFVGTVCLPQIGLARLLASIYLPILLLWALSLPGQKKMSSSSGQQEPARVRLSMDLFDDVYSKSVRIMIKIAGYLMLFSILNQLLAHEFPAWKPVLGILGGILEMTYGIRCVSSLALPDAVRECICLFFLGFGGISGMLQVRDALTKDLFSLGRYLLFRCLHGTLAALCCFLLGLV